jgi:hypothetical protein
MISIPTGIRAAPLSLKRKHWRYRIFQFHSVSPVVVDAVLYQSTRV